MVTCEACGKDIAVGSAFCTSCGAVLTPPPTVPEPRTGSVKNPKELFRGAGRFR